MIDAMFRMAQYQKVFIIFFFLLLFLGIVFLFLKNYRKWGYSILLWILGMPFAGFCAFWIAIGILTIFRGGSWFHGFLERDCQNLVFFFLKSLLVFFVFLFSLGYRRLAQYILAWALQSFLAGIIAGFLSFFVQILLWPDAGQGAILFLMTSPLIGLIFAVAILIFSILRLILEWQRLVVCEKNIHRLSWIFSMIIFLGLAIALVFVPVLSDPSHPFIYVFLVILCIALYVSKPKTKEIIKN